VEGGSGRKLVEGGGFFDDSLVDDWFADCH